MTEYFWSQADVDFLEQNAPTMTARQIAAELRCTIIAVRYKAQRSGITILTENGNLPWTPERRDEAIRLWKEGHSASEVARSLGGGLTRSAIIGVVHRAGASARERATSPLANTRFRPEPHIPKPRRPAAPTMRLVASSTPFVEPTPPPIPADLAKVSLMALNSRTQCGWNLGPDIWCGEPKLGHFCAFHTPIGTNQNAKPFRPYVPSERKAPSLPRQDHGAPALRAWGSDW